MTSFDLDLTKYQLGWSDEVEYAFAPAKGINPGVVEQISWWKGEPKWMTGDAPAGAAHVRAQADGAVVRRQHARHRLPGHLLLPASPPASRSTTGTTSPTQMQATYEKLGIPEAERQYLAGVTAQYE